MGLDRNFFEKNREIIINVAERIESGSKRSGIELSDHTDEQLKEIADGYAASLGRALFEYLKLRNKDI